MPKFDKDKLDGLITSLENSEDTLSRAIIADDSAQANAQFTTTQLAVAGTSNRAAVKALKDFADSMNDDGSTPDAPIGVTGAVGGTGPSGSTGSSASDPTSGASSSTSATVTTGTSAGN